MLIPGDGIGKGEGLFKGGEPFERDENSLGLGDPLREVRGSGER